jgi:hypothetical protein
LPGSFAHALADALSHGRTGHARFVASLSAARFQDRSSLRCALSRHSAGTGDEQTL